MPTTVRCPNCAESFPVQDYEGPRVECPSCGTRFERGRGRPSYAPPDRDFDRGEAAALEPGTLPILMRGGLLQLFANFLHMLALVLVLVLVLRELDKSTAGPGSEKVQRLMVLTLAFSLVTSWFLNVIAGACWAMASTRGVSRPLGVAVLCFSVLVVWQSADFLLLTTPLLDRDRGGFDDRFGGRSMPGLILGAFYIDVVRMIVFAGYLSAAARDTGRTRAQTPATILAIVAPVLLLGPIGLTTLVGLVDKIGPDWGQVMVLLMVAGALVTVLWTLVVVFQLRGAWGRMGRLTRDD